MSEYSRAAKLKNNRAHVRFDRFGIFQVGRKHNLKALDRWLLMALSMVCDYRTGDWFGTITELSEDTGQEAGATGATRKAVAASLDRLAGAELVQIISPFGKNAQGHLRVLALNLLRVDVNEVERFEKPTPHIGPFRAQHAPDTSTTRDEHAPNDANASPDDWLVVEPQGAKEEGDTGENDSRARVGEELVARFEDEFGAVVVELQGAHRE